MESFFVLIVVILIIVLITRSGAEERKRVDKERSKNYKSAPIDYVNKSRDYPISTTSSTAITKKTCLKTIKGATLFESSAVENGGTLPNYVAKARANGEIRVNCLTQGDIFLRSDGALFHIQPNYGFMPEHIHPDDREKNRIIDDLRFEYQGCEYVLDDFCPDKKNIWQVIIAVKRTGRCCFGNKKNQLKKTMI